MRNWEGPDFPKKYVKDWIGSNRTDGSKIARVETSYGHCTSASLFICLGLESGEKPGFIQNGNPFDACGKRYPRQSPNSTVLSPYALRKVTRAKNSGTRLFNNIITSVTKFQWVGV